MNEDLEHFVAAQNPVLDQVTRELSQGKKQSHWMWYIFPQLAGLGSSAMARRFAISCLAHAQRYLEHPILDQRLRAHTQLVLQVQDRSLAEIFGNPDDLKFHSSMTLFHLASPEDPLFQSALAKYFAGRPDTKTLELLKVGN